MLFSHMVGHHVDFPQPARIAMRRLLPLLLVFLLMPDIVQSASAGRPECIPLPILENGCGELQSPQNCPPPSDATFLCATSEGSDSWQFRPSYYSHDPNSGERVAQYQPLPNVYRPEDPTYMVSGYRHNQTIMRGADGSADWMHVVETWGNPVRPYGEWEFPYRAGATPYGPWGNPQGPWTMPFDSWVNPYGLGQLPNPPWGPYYQPYNSPYPNSSHGYSPGGLNGGAMPYQGGPYGGTMQYQGSPHDGSTPYQGGLHGGSMHAPAPPPAPEIEE
jgi:hypothetical protein